MQLPVHECRVPAGPGRRVIEDGAELVGDGCRGRGLPDGRGQDRLDVVGQPEELGFGVLHGDGRDPQRNAGAFRQGAEHQRQVAAAVQGADVFGVDSVVRAEHAGERVEVFVHGVVLVRSEERRERFDAVGLQEGLEAEVDHLVHAVDARGAVGEVDQHLRGSGRVQAAVAELVGVGFEQRRRDCGLGGGAGEGVALRWDARGG